jgi:hypothetical protein
MEGTYCDACYCVTNIKHYCVARQNLSHLCFIIFIEMYYYTFRGHRQIDFIDQSQTCSVKQSQNKSAIGGQNLFVDGPLGSL